MIKSEKKVLIAFALALVFGPFGAHRFYVGKYISGLIMLGICFIFPILAVIIQIIDLFAIAFGKFKDSEGFVISNKLW